MAIRKSAKRWLSCCAVCGTTLLVVGACLWLILAPVIVSIIAQLNFITSEDSDLYPTFAETWLNTTETIPDEIPAYEAFWLFNLTNTDEVLLGGKPNFVEVGPYVYRVNLSRLDIEFRNDGEFVKFTRRKVYLYDFEQSFPLVDKDPDNNITNINVAYMAAVTNAASETGLRVVMGLPALQDQLKRLEDLYIKPKVDADPGLAAYCKSVDPDCNTLEDQTLFHWGYIFDRRVYGLTNSSASRGSASWGPIDTAIREDQPDDFPEPIEYSVPVIGTTRTTITIAQAKKLFYGDYGLLNTPELLEFFARSLGNSTSDEEFEQLFGIDKIQGQSFVAYVAAPSPLGIMYYADDLLKTIREAGGGLIGSRTAHAWLWGYVDPLLIRLSPADSCVYSFFNSTTEADKASCVYTMYEGVPLNNDTVIYLDEGPWEFNTGKFDILEVHNMTLFDNKTVFDWFSTPVKIAGNAGVGQFPYYPVSGTGSTADVLPDVLVWSADHGRPLVFKDTGEKIYLEGIMTHQFEIANDTYDPNPLYDLPQGFKGFVNSAGWNDKAPVFYSPPHLYLVDEGWRSNFTGIMGPNRKDDSTFIWVEPITGLALGGNGSLQANTYIATNEVLSLYYPDVTDNTMYPYLWTKQYSTVTPDLAQLLQDDLFSLLDIVFVLWYTLMALGTVVLLAVVIFFARERRIVATTGYRLINE